MGMFDDLRCEVPIPDGFAGPFQTKDFGCMLKTHVISASGRMMIDPGFTFDDPAERIDANYHGFVRFYGHDPAGKWHEYQAKFTDGQLVGIEVVPDDTAAQEVP